MGKQKMVLKLAMEDAKKRSKALRTAVGLPGVTLAEIEGDKIVVIGEGVDSVRLTLMLRKKMGFAELVSVSPVEEKKKEEKKKEEKKDKAPEVAKSVEPVVWPYQVTMAPQPYMYPYQTKDSYYNYQTQEPSYKDDSCSIM